MAGKFIIQKQTDGTYRFSLMQDNEEIGFADGFEQLDAAKRAVKAVKKSCRAKVQAVGEELGLPKYALGQDGKSFSLIAQNGAKNSKPCNKKAKTRLPLPLQSRPYIRMKLSGSMKRWKQSAPKGKRRS